MFKLPEEYLKRMQAQLPDSYAAFLDTYSDTPQKGLRVNTLKISPGDFEKISPFKLGEKVPWESGGYYTDADGLGKSVLHSAGLYYVQEPSAMSAAPCLEVIPGDKVLDLCSAPGGKGTQLAAKMNGSGVLVLNEPDRARYGVLCGNVERTGVKNAVVTCANPKQLEDVFYGYFNKFLVDAPCSGEGMFRKEPAAISQWSTESVRACAVRQQKILESAHKMLAGGGIMVYSTCTFSQEEDERQILNFVQAHSEYKILKTEKLYPHKVRGEGHFYAVLQKGGDGIMTAPANVRPVKNSAVNVYREWEKATLLTSLPDIYLNGNLVFSVAPEQLQISLKLSKLGIPARAGIFAGEIADGKRFEPAHCLAMSLKSSEVRCIDVDYNTALNYLRGRTFTCPENLRGWYAVTYLGYPLGWCKAVNAIAKNHLPKGLRI